MACLCLIFDIVCLNKTTGTLNAFHINRLNSIDIVCTITFLIYFRTHIKLLGCDIKGIGVYGVCCE